MARLRYLAGRSKSPFRRSSTAETFASVLEGQPDYGAMPADTPDPVRHLVRRCMEKEQARRMHHMGDVRILLEDARAPGGTSSSVRPARASARGLWAAVAVAIAAFSAAIPFLDRPATYPMGTRHLAVSPDGSTVAYAGGAGRIWIRRLDRQDATSMEFARAIDPFFSPDGEWLGVFDETSLMKIPSRRGGRMAPSSLRRRKGCIGSARTASVSSWPSRIAAEENGSTRGRICCRAESRCC